MNQATFLDAPEHAPPANPFADPRPIAVCDGCGRAAYHDRRIHAGESIIRECARCRRFMGFPRWYGQEAPR